MSGHTKIQHILLVPLPAYGKKLITGTTGTESFPGHTRPLCALAGRLVAAGNIVITMLMAPNWVQKAKIVSLFESTETQIFALVPMVAKHYPGAYETLLRGAAIKCTSTGVTFPEVPPPMLQATRSISGTEIPILTFVAANGGALIRMFCPESMGGCGDLGARIDAEALRVGKTAKEVADQIYTRTDGIVVRIPGLPPMYDYEHFPQTMLDGPVAALNRAAYDMIMACDGIFAGTTPIYDGESFAAFEAWVRKTLHKPVYAVGPLLPPGYGEKQSSPAITTKDVKIESFLDTMRSKYGDRSVLFISFGTIFWPTVVGQVEDLVDALVEKQFPFFLCHASPLAVMSDALLEKIKASGIGMTSTWAPQQFILTHPATGWLLTPCGHGGIIESLASGVPMICWPFGGDQPIAAVHLSENLNVAFHLMEVRTGKGLQPLHNGLVPLGTRTAMSAELRLIFDQCRDEVGKEKRRNAERMREKVANAWVAGGPSVVAMNAFFADFSVFRDT
ncbi:hypothetical protein B0H13DRAFT_1881517 [Mycena leptocephala]|nr:hypothetical protein B0H13DRAFT_1881517 [Mycena leptocephala]